MKLGQFEILFHLGCEFHQFVVFEELIISSKLLDLHAKNDSQYFLIILFMSTGSVVIAFLLSDINNLSFLYFFVSFASFISFSLLRESAFVSLIFLYFPIFNVIISVLKFLISFCMFSIYSEVFIFVLFSFLKWKLRLLI